MEINLNIKIFIKCLKLLSDNFHTVKVKFCMYSSVTFFASCPCSHHSDQGIEALHHLR